MNAMDKDLVFVCCMLLSSNCFGNNSKSYKQAVFKEIKYEKLMTTFKKNINKVHCMHVVQKKEMKLDWYPY